MSDSRRVKLGELLIEKGFINNSQLNEALAKQKTTGQRLGAILQDLNYVSRNDVINTISQQLKIPIIDLSMYKIKPEVINKLSEKIARKYRMLLIDDIADKYLLGMVDPMDIMAFDEVKQILDKPIRMSVITEEDFVKYANLYYRQTSKISNIAEKLSNELAEEERKDIDLNKLPEQVSESEAPVVKLINTIFKDAVQMQASDIHIEPCENVLRIRQRIDGVLYEHTMPETIIATALISRLKLMANLDISEKRLPQDGRFEISVSNKKFDVRFSSIPTQHGESVVMRLLDAGGGILNLDEIGIPSDTLSRLKNMIERPHGMILVTGPTGSGKTTTLYGCLNEINSPEKKIITVEDPIEYSLERVNQVQVLSKIDLTFARVLRSMLRQDPDVMMVGEIRDQETASIALRAAITGHLVFSTLHTNDAISTVIRLIDMGIEPYLLAGALKLIIAQRLIRRLCNNCKQPCGEIPKEQLSYLKAYDINVNASSIYRAKGCDDCHYTGYQGRIPIFEYLEVTEMMMSELRGGELKGFVEVAKKAEGYRTLVQEAYQLALEGKTSIHEVMRIAGDAEDL